MAKFISINRHKIKQREGKRSMTVLFFKVEDVLNFPETEAKAPSGKLGIVDRLVKNLQAEQNKLGPGAQLVLYGEWTKDWNFDNDFCSADGKYLNRKLERRGLHIMDKAEGEDPILHYIQRKHVDHHKILA